MWVHPDSVFSLQKEVDLQKHHVSIHMLHYLNMFLDNVQRLVMRKTSLSYLLKAYCKIFVYQSRHCGIYIYMYVLICNIYFSLSYFTLYKLVRKTALSLHLTTYQTAE